MISIVLVLKQGLVVYDAQLPSCTATGSCTPISATPTTDTKLINMSQSDDVPGDSKQTQTSADGDVQITQLSTLTRPMTDKQQDKCPLSVRKAMGIYKNATSTNNPFSNVVLLTASNNDFSSLLDNWKAFCDEHGFKYAILAMDDALYQRLGPDQAVPSSPEYMISKAVQKKKYFKLVCNKMRMILQIIQDCQVDVVFSDADNVLLKDPFVHDLGRLIVDGYYDYLYTTNDAWTPTERSHKCMTGGLGDDEEGNTGFEYIRSSRPWVQDIMETTLRKCDRPKNNAHDQTLFWKLVHRRKNDQWKQCTKDNYEESFKGTRKNNETEVPTMCCLDPHYYTVGASKPERPETVIAFHANYVKTPSEKADRLKEWVNGWKGS